MDLSTIRDRLRRRIGSPGTAKVTESDLNENINDAYRDIASKFRHHKSRKQDSITTIVGTTQYALPADVGAVLRVWDDTNKKRLKRRGARFFAELGTQENGKPKDYVRFGSNLEILPPADGVYTIQVYYSHTIVALTDAASPALHETWHIGGLHLSEWYYYVDRGDPEKADSAYKIWLLWIRDKPVEIDDETVDMEQGVIIPTLSESVSATLDFDESE